MTAYVCIAAMFQVDWICGYELKLSSKIRTKQMDKQTAKKQADSRVKLNINKNV